MSDGGREFLLKVEGGDSGKDLPGHKVTENSGSRQQWQRRLLAHVCHGIPLH